MANATNYDFQIAKTVLTDNEKDRIVCLYFNRRPDGSVDWDKAAINFGSASANSMRISAGNSLKKIEKAGGKLEGDGDGGIAATPKKGKKRVASPEGDDEETIPAPKKGRKKKQIKEATVDSAEEDTANVKSEQVD